MANEPSSDLIAFDVEYVDGRKVVMLVNTHDLRDDTDSIARIIARERQEKGSMPPGTIASVTRRR
jgi:hypothetical protein